VPFPCKYSELGLRKLQASACEQPATSSVL
jgi:hypothetical protein